MKKHIKIAAFLAFAAAGSASAQVTYSGYFLEDYLYKFQMNPAFGNESTFFSIPAIGNVNMAVRGNFGLNSIFYNVDGKTVLFTNPDITADQAMSKFKNTNRLSESLKLDLMSGGFKEWGGYNTISLSLVQNVNVKVPKTLFQFVKEDITNQEYSIGKTQANANAYLQLALNHSRDIPQVPGLRAGAAMKFYIGGANVDAYLDKADLNLGTDAWTGITQADIYASVNGLKYKTEYDDKSKKDYISEIDYKYKGLTGFGIGFDLGATYKWKDFNFSLAVLDLGFISWGKTQWASTNGEQEVNTGDYLFSADGSAPNSFENEWDRLSGDLARLYQLSDMGEISRTRAMAATVNIGVDYEFPLYRPLHFGFLSSTVINGGFTWSQARFSANVAPLKWLSASANLEASTYGVGFGWLLNLYTKGFNFFVGMDHTMGKLTKNGIPLNSNGAVNVGINIPL